MIILEKTLKGYSGLTKTGKNIFFPIVRVDEKNNTINAISSNAIKIVLTSFKDTLSIKVDETLVYESKHPTEDVLRAILEESTDSMDIEKFSPEEWDIEKIIDVIQPDFLDKSLEEGKSSSTPLMTDTVVKDVKRGDILYITALLKPKNTTASYNPGQIGVLKVRIVDLYYNLSSLKHLK